MTEQVSHPPRFCTMRLSHHRLKSSSFPNSITASRFNLHRHNQHLLRLSFPISHAKPLNPNSESLSINQPSSSDHPLASNHDSLSFLVASPDEINGGGGGGGGGGGEIDKTTRCGELRGTLESDEEKSFWGAVGLIIGTAVGPGMLGLPAATLKSGPLPATFAILLSWVYVISSIVLVVELSFAAMEEDRVAEVSFTGLATKALGNNFGAFVSVVYACLCFALLVACVSGIGSIVSQWFPGMNLVLAHSLFPLVAGIVIMFFPFKVIDTANRLLCVLMLFSITSLVAIGMFVARTNVLGSFARASWSVSSILPAIPVTVLTLGFHVITPFICKIAGNTVSEARKAILVGGVVPLIMVLSWNLIVLGLAGTNPAISSPDPISLLLSVNPSALSVVQGFAHSALATSLIGYAVSFPKQLVDTFKQIFEKSEISNENEEGKVGFAVYSYGHCDIGNVGKISCNDSKRFKTSDVNLTSNLLRFGSIEMFVMPLLLGVPAVIAPFFRSTFSRALDFAGVYANCFLFGILPPAMAYIQQFKKKLRKSILPGGNITLLLLFSIAVVLGIWH